MPDKKRSKIARTSERATYLFDPDAIRDSTKPPEDAARLIWLVLGLIRNGRVEYARYVDGFGRSEKTFRRDVAKLHELGREFGFAIGISKLTITLSHLDRPPKRATDDGAARDALRAAAEALGRIVTDSISKLVDLGGPSDAFLRFAAPKVVDSSALAATYRALRSAWERNARATFHFPGRDGAPAERTVEPYFISYHSGRYYLTAFDVRPRGGGWRQFSIDRIAGDVRSAGTFRPRPIAPAYARAEALGLFKTGTISQDVTIRLSPVIASAVCARKWQTQQRVVASPDGSATIAFEVYDLGEAVRWAFAFGIEATVVSPDAAVDLAARWTRDMASTYAVPVRAAQTA